MKKLINKSELAKLFSVSTQAIDGWIRRGCPVHDRDSGGRIKSFSLQDVIQWRTYKYSGASNTAETEAPNILSDLIATEYLPRLMDHASLIISADAHNECGISKRKSIELIQMLCLTLMESTSQYLESDDLQFKISPRLQIFMTKGKALDQAIKKYWPKGDEQPFKSVQAES